MSREDALGAVIAVVLLAFIGYCAIRVNAAFRNSKRKK